MENTLSELTDGELKLIEKWANQNKNRAIESKVAKMRSPPKRKREKIDNNVALLQFDSGGYPWCENHGAMTCINKPRSVWRCSVCGKGVSFKSVEALDEWIILHSTKSELLCEILSFKEREKCFVIKPVYLQCRYCDHHRLRNYAPYCKKFKELVSILEGCE